MIPTQPLEGGESLVASDVSPETPCYRPDLRRVTLGELFRLSGPLAFPVAFVSFKVLRNQLPLGHASPMPDRLIPVEAEAVPEGLGALRQPLLDAVAAAGFRRLFEYRMPRIRDDGSTGVSAFHLNDDGSIAAVVVAAESRTPLKVVRRVLVAFTTRCTDGRSVATTDQERKFDPPPESDVEYSPGRSPAALLARHRDRIAALGPGQIAPLRPEEAQAFALANERRWLEFQRDRGVMVPLTDEERARLFGGGAGGTKGRGAAMVKTLLLWLALFALAVLLFEVL